MKISILDTTLRDGSQGLKVSHTVSDKLKIINLLDEFGLGYIEVGNPYYSLKDKELWENLKGISLKNSKIACFGSTRRAGISINSDEAFMALASTPSPVSVIFGKSWDRQVKGVLQTSLDENLSMIEDSVKYLVSIGKEVIFDAEHFFDGYKENPEYALSTIKTADKAGASVICLCDTNGGTFPDEVKEIIEKVRPLISCDLGFHGHNDGGMAISNSVFAAFGGATHIQGTMIGIGERSGNANLSSVIANLQLKKGYDIVPDLSNLTYTCRAIADISNLSMRDLPFVGKNAFSHKAGTHIDGVMKDTSSFEHIDPEKVGNDRSFLISEVSGKSAVYAMMKKIIPGIDKNAPEISKVVTRLKELEYEGYQFEGAPASFELEIRKVLGLLDKPFFKLDKLRLLIEQDDQNESDGYSSAYIKLSVEDEAEIAASDSESGPINALDSSLRRALERFYPDIKKIKLTDYKVRVLNSASATGATVRVLIESSDSVNSWTTVGVSKDIIMASKKALLDSFEYYLSKYYKNEA